MKRKYSKPGFKKVKLDAAVLLSKGCKSAEHHGRDKDKSIAVDPGRDLIRGQGCHTNGFFVRSHEQGS